MAGLDGTALALDWAAAGRGALEDPVAVDLPFEEEGYITAEDPSAVGYRVHVPRGRKLTFGVYLDSEEGTRLFVDLLPRARGRGRSAQTGVLVGLGGRNLRPRRRMAGEGDYILRLQPELLRGGTYRVILTQEAQFAFPVEGYGMGAIQSVFGADRATRDGAEHHGVDIFARRGTPVLAASAVAPPTGWATRTSAGRWCGYATRTAAPASTTHTWTASMSATVCASSRATRSVSWATRGTRALRRRTCTSAFTAAAGAHSTPIEFLDPPRGTLCGVDGGRGVARGAACTRATMGSTCVTSPGTRSDVLMELDASAPSLRVLGASGDWYRVLLPGGEGWVRGRAAHGGGGGCCGGRGWGRRGGVATRSARSYALRAVPY